MQLNEYWENIFRTKEDDQVSWSQDNPITPINYLKEIDLDKNAKIIDVGGGASKFVDLLLDEGYTDITVLDISSAALRRSQVRLGYKATKVKWIVSDVLNFDPSEQFDFWYDRAAFHFLTADEQISTYRKLVSRNIVENGHFLLGTFSDQGPLKCSGLDIKQYSELKMKSVFQDDFTARKCFAEMHVTPFNTEQHFQFCGFVKKK